MSFVLPIWVLQNKIPSCDDPRLMAKPKIRGNVYSVLKSFCSTNPDVVVSEGDVVYQNICELNQAVIDMALKYEWIKLFGVEKVESP